MHFTIEPGGFIFILFFIIPTRAASHLSPEEAEQIAFEYYIKAMNLVVLAEEEPRTPTLIKLGTDVANFAGKGDLIWKVRISTIENELRAIIFVHDQTKKTYLLFSPHHLESINAEPENLGPAEKESSAAFFGFNAGYLYVSLPFCHQMPYNPTGFFCIFSIFDFSLYRKISYNL